jgi:hypothetical protein
MPHGPVLYYSEICILLFQGLKSFTIIVYNFDKNHLTKLGNLSNLVSLDLQNNVLSGTRLFFNKKQEGVTLLYFIEIKVTYKQK